MVGFDDLRQGDRVEHRGGHNGLGVVASKTKETIIVIYDRRSERDGKNWRGVYDRVWFRQYPNLLVHA